VLSFSGVLKGEGILAVAEIVKDPPLTGSPGLRFFKRPFMKPFPPCIDGGSAAYITGILVVEVDPGIGEPIIGRKPIIYTYIYIHI
jgi:hypothetical protein